MPDKKESDPMAMFASFAGMKKSSSKVDPTSSGSGDNTATTEKRAKPCRVCDSFKNWRRHEAKAHVKDSKDKAGLATGVGSSVAASASTGTLVGDECPPDSQVLGRATWTFLHTMAAYYPEKADTKQQDMMKSLLTSFSHFYPCGRCASHLRGEMSRHPPPVDTRTNLSIWLCQTHNKVNVMLGKDEFDCSKLDERWRDGPKDGRCSWAQDIEY
ncbi:Flavin-linked sulfhydryl oxidase of the mitochondrial IMS [Coemansia spiralis]|uniref:Sulfhydryl oxidase n=2 Tax=Coemansia TaxID=4863 RepID=A0A9W8KWU3_9FUNG|nr:FAD-linked sulfhydryl oxidase ALR [Coemansia spiralis]KAJ1989094.1 Flavin-linked sulfhydryl oxidase of the mitochondrial IMS [Coemansia umbellata]KAJ2620228.1 Flavin-linked sulfhydryl oxidase of the mitochondrial IMS [Coemansia sp. RSA 1358]KAJ2672556.1 Flavin-linked sulfhydryl oxidase of the mitochondrial IMS [Coemansia spiralis]